MKKVNWLCITGGIIVGLLAYVFYKECIEDTVCLDTLVFDTDEED